MISISLPTIYYIPNKAKLASCVKNSLKMTRKLEKFFEIPSDE